MRHRSSITSVSWIPPFSVPGVVGMLFDGAVTRYDHIPPRRITGLGELEHHDGFRSANELGAWIEVDGDRVLGAGYTGRGHMGSTTVRLGGRTVTLPAIPFEDRRAEPEVLDDRVRFVQTTGGRPALPAPRPVGGWPFVQVRGPIVWTTLALEIFVDGTSRRELVGASEFPRHWLYDHDGRLVAKSARLEFDGWYRHAFGSHSPWSGEDRPVVLGPAESDLERGVIAELFGRERLPRTVTLQAGETLVRQGEPGDEVYVVLDGVLTVEIDGEGVARVGPGMVQGEMARFSGGRRNATVTALTACRIAVLDRPGAHEGTLAALSLRRPPPKALSSRAQ